MTKREFLDIVFALAPNEANAIMDAFDEYVESAQLGTNLAEVGTDCISRQQAIDARRYTFGNDEFSLEAAYHDCKLVFDGITGDDSFQEADTGLILYYANEIIYALQEALEGKDTNVPTNDHISRQAAIDAVRMVIGDNRSISVCDAIKQLPPIQPEIVRCKDCKLCREENQWMI